jgi:hypothetical protein
MVAALADIVDRYNFHRVRLDQWMVAEDRRGPPCSARCSADFPASAANDRESLDRDTSHDVDGRPGRLIGEHGNARDTREDRGNSCPAHFYHRAGAYFKLRGTC